MPPLANEPSYHLRDEDYRLTIHHRLGQLPFDDMRDELCIGCARRNATNFMGLDFDCTCASVAASKCISTVV